MKKTLTTGLMIVLSAAVLSACGSDGSLNTAALKGNENTFSQLSFEKGTRNKMGGQMSDKQGSCKGFAFGFLSELSLTSEQKTQIQSIMETAKANQPKRPDAPDTAAIQAVQAKINAAFISDSFDADALHAEMVSLHTAKASTRTDHAAMELARAQQTLDIWNLLTAEQKATATTKATELASKVDEKDANRPPHAEKRPEQGLAQLTEKLSLSTDQQAALTTAFEANRPAPPKKPDIKALMTLLNSGSATAESIAALHTRPEKLEHNPLTRLATLHKVLTTEQRKTFASSGLLKPPPHGGPGKHGGPHGHGGPGGPGEHPPLPFDAQ